MKEIKLTQGMNAIVDDEDYDFLVLYKWHVVNGYAQNTKKTPLKVVNIYMHRLIMDFPDGEVDHINNNTLDNRKSNLRICSHRQNQLNQKLSRRNTSGYRGVSKYGKKWRAYISINGNDLFLGYFKTPEEAAKAYDQKSMEFHGEFGKRNY